MRKIESTVRLPYKVAIILLIFLKQFFVAVLFLNPIQYFRIQFEVKNEKNRPCCGISRTQGGHAISRECVYWSSIIFKLDMKSEIMRAYVRKFPLVQLS